MPMGDEFTDESNTLESELDAAQASSSVLGQQRGKAMEIFQEHFGVSELRDLIWCMGWDVDDFSTDKRILTRQLIFEMERLGEATRERLIALLFEKRGTQQEISELVDLLTNWR